MAVENNRNEFKENEVILNNFIEENKNLTIVKSKDFIDILFEIVIENSNIYQN